MNVCALYINMNIFSFIDIVLFLTTFSLFLLLQVMVAPSLTLVKVAVMLATIMQHFREAGTGLLAGRKKKMVKTLLFGSKGPQGTSLFLLPQHPDLCAGPGIAKKITLTVTLFLKNRTVYLA